MKIAFPGKKMQTMAERFEEALGTSSVINEGTHVRALSSLRYKIVAASWHSYAITNEFELILNVILPNCAELEYLQNYSR